MTNSPNVQAELDALQDEYTYRLNLVLAEDRVDLAWALSNEYSDVASRILNRDAAA